MSLYQITDENFEVVARHCTLGQAAAITGANRAWLAGELRREGFACHAQFCIAEQGKPVYGTGYEVGTADQFEAYARTIEDLEG